MSLLFILKFSGSQTLFTRCAVFEVIGFPSTPIIAKLKLEKVTPVFWGFTFKFIRWTRYSIPQQSRLKT